MVTLVAAMQLGGNEFKSWK